MTRGVEKILAPPLSKRENDPGSSNSEFEKKRTSRTEVSNSQEFSDLRTKSSDNLTQNKSQETKKDKDEKDEEEDEESSSDSDWGLEDPVDTVSTSKKSILKN
jgi:hypothetical protein